VLLDRPVAVTVLKWPERRDAEARTHFVESFVREARIIARSSHPNIVQVIDFGLHRAPSGEEWPWMALEWLDGVTLRASLLARRGQHGRPPYECLALLEPVLDALATAHAAQIAHRDIKPSNLMILETRSGPQLKLLDFGIAKVMSESEEAGDGDTRTRSSMAAFSL
jgi:serine/threonine-protein kinase